MRGGAGVAQGVTEGLPEGSLGAPTRDAPPYPALAFRRERVQGGPGVSSDAPGNTARCC
ncbi:protein of unknown function [Nitrospira defluvii]|uniref:Uncharacterized protein n=1 Tax=Nitrospira defluvii TaxID=330214 RepID=D8PIZ2_9BACT|nr:protein of unknown function [Nitrospira defluvii]